MFLVECQQVRKMKTHLRWRLTVRMGTQRKGLRLVRDNSGAYQHLAISRRLQDNMQRRYGLTWRSWSRRCSLEMMFILSFFKPYSLHSSSLCNKFLSFHPKTKKRVSSSFLYLLAFSC
uniref:Uncharacterized protein n=1 Tax=Brassica campestris TaxID=3711 RepID=A0A3P5YCU3_BRACM|nr:unnamed protein product [Brassica rapa]